MKRVVGLVDGDGERNQANKMTNGGCDDPASRHVERWQGMALLTSARDLLDERAEGTAKSGGKSLE